MWRVRDPKSHETRAQTPALAFKSGIFYPCPTAWFCRTLQMTTRKPRASLQQSSPEPEQTGPYLNSSFQCLIHFLIFFLPCNEWKTRKKTGGEKKSRHLVPTSSSFECVFPSFIYGTETEPHKWTGGSCSTARAPHRRRGKNKSVPNP